MRAVLAGTAVLCLCLAQPASAAWTTSRQGTANAKAGTVTQLVITSCVPGKPTAVSWQRVPGASEYVLTWQKGGGQSQFNQTATTSALTYNVPESIGVVRVQATIGSWATSYTQKDCP